MSNVRYRYNYRFVIEARYEQPPCIAGKPIEVLAEPVRTFEYKGEILESELEDEIRQASRVRLPVAAVLAEVMSNAWRLLLSGLLAWRETTIALQSIPRERSGR